MYATTTKDNATSSPSSRSATGQKEEGSVVDPAQKAELPFFAPASSRHSGTNGRNTSQHTPFFQPRPQPLIQPKLTINEPGDKYEQEADAMADRVMRMSDFASPPPADIPASEPSAGKKEEKSPTLRRMLMAPIFSPTGRVEVAQRSEKEEEEEQVQRKEKPFGNAWDSEPVIVQRKCAACEEEEKVQRQEMEEEEPLQTKPLMRKAEGGGYTASPKLASQLDSSKGGGDPLSGQTLGFMNQAFGADFSSVRIHTGSQAAEMSQGIQAKAFTHGSDIYFNREQYSPETSEGKRLLGHELTHLVQQGTDSIVQMAPDRTEKQRHSLPDIAKAIEQMRDKTRGLVVQTREYSMNGLQSADKARIRIDESFRRYEGAYNSHEAILKKARKENTADESSWMTWVGIGIGIAASVIASPIASAVFVGATARALGSLAISIGGSLGSLGVEPIREVTKGIANPESFDPVSPHPQAAKLKHYINLVDLYRSIGLVGIENIVLSLLLEQMADLQKCAEFPQARAQKKLSPAEISKMFYDLRNNLDANFHELPIRKFETLNSEINGHPIPSENELEQYIWLAWLSARVYISGEDEEAPTYNDTELIDIDIIEYHLYDLGIMSRYEDSDSILGKESWTGKETTYEDTKRIALLANSKWYDIKRKYKYLFEGF